jgi:hypothetical protein
MKNQPVRTLALAGVVVGAFHAAAYGQQPMLRAELLAGPWEVASPSGIDGIFLKIDTHPQRTADPQIASGQAVSIRVYHRQSGRETWGWYSADAASVFDGQHLQIQRTRNGPCRESHVSRRDTTVDRHVVPRRPTARRCARAPSSSVGRATQSLQRGVGRNTSRLGLRRSANSPPR